MKRLCLVVPSYRDSTRLRTYLPDLCTELSEIPGISILVVDDGSGGPDANQTKACVLNLAKRYGSLLEPLMLERNRGKGGAVYAGWDVASGSEWLGFVDADGATPAREVARFVRMALDDPDAEDVYVGSRIKILGRKISRSLARHLSGRLFATLSTWMTGWAIYDSQCGCKLLKRDAYLKVKGDLVETRFAFDIDLLVNLLSVGARVREVPVDWSDVPGSKVSLVRDGFQMTHALWKLRGRMRRKTQMACEISDRP